MTVLAMWQGVLILIVTAVANLLVFYGIVKGKLQEHDDELHAHSERFDKLESRYDVLIPRREYESRDKLLADRLDRIENKLDRNFKWGGGI